MLSAILVIKRAPSNTEKKSINLLLKNILNSLNCYFFTNIYSAPHAFLPLHTHAAKWLNVGTSTIVPG